MAKKTYQERDLKFETLQLHVGQEDYDPVTDARAVPIYQTSSFVFQKSASMQQTDLHLQMQVTFTEDLQILLRIFLKEELQSLRVVLQLLQYASGAAAVSYTIQNLAFAGDHIVAAKNVYGGTYNLLAHTMVDYNVTTTFVDPLDPQNFEDAIQDNTKGYYI